MGKRKLPYNAHFKLDLKDDKKIFEEHYNVLLDSVSANAYRHFCKHDLLLQNKKKEFHVNFDSGNMLVKMKYLPKNGDYLLSIFLSAKNKSEFNSVKNSIEEKILSR